jgi:hypothetical protein
MKKVFLLVFCCCNLSAMMPLVPGEDRGQHVFETLLKHLFPGKCFTTEDVEQSENHIRRSFGYGTMNQGVSMACESMQQKKETTPVQTEDITQ